MAIYDSKATDMAVNTYHLSVLFRLNIWLPPKLQSYSSLQNGIQPISHIQTDE